MDLETENRLAALLMEEARRLRNEADKDGVHVYLHRPNVRGRPNSRFLTATVLGVEQANRAAEISEMWRAREKERELDARQRHDESKDKISDTHVRNGPLKEGSKPWSEKNSVCGVHSRHEGDFKDSSISCSKQYSEDYYSDDDELEQFLHSRMKRGRGSIGPRMDEPGPYLQSTSADHDERNAISHAERLEGGHKHSRPTLGPEKPHFLKCHPSHDGVDASKVEASNRHHCEEKKKNKKSENNKSGKAHKSRHEKKKHSRDSRNAKHMVHKFDGCC